MTVRSEVLARLRPAPAGPARARDGDSALLRSTHNANRSVAKVSIETVPTQPTTHLAARRYRPFAMTLPATLVYFGNDGRLTGSLENSDGICRALAVASGAEVVGVEYRKPPVHAFPAATDDAFRAVCWLAAAGPIVTVGEGLGGNLAAVTAIRARDAGGPEIALQILVCPITDHIVDTASYRRHHDGLPAGKAEIERFWREYVPNAPDRECEWASPLRAADLTHLPHAHVLVAEYDPLRDQGLAYAERLADSGGHVTVERYENMVHGFLPMVGLLSEANTAIIGIGAHIRTALRRM